MFKVQFAGVPKSSVAIEICENDFCIVCGNHEIKLLSKGTSSSNKGYYYDMQCKKCQNRMVYFYCWLYLRNYNMQVFHQ